MATYVATRDVVLIAKKVIRYASESEKDTAGASAAAAAGPFGKKTIKVGDTVPSVEIDLGFPPSKVNVLEYTQQKTVILMGLPGAYTPT